MHPSPLVLCLEQAIYLLDLKWPNSSWAYLTRFSCCYRQNTTHTHPSTHTCRRESPSHLKCLALCTTKSHSSSVNPIKTSQVYNYAMTRVFRAPLPFGSMSILWESPSFTLVWSTSPKHPNRVQRYVEACHLGITSKSTSPCQQTPMVSSSLELGFWLNPLAYWLTLLGLWTMSKTYSYRINAHLAYFLMSGFNFIRNFKGWGKTQANRSRFWSDQSLVLMFISLIN